MTHEEYVARAEEIRPKAKVLEEYKGSKSKILHQCECGTKWEASPSTILNSCKCGGCRPSEGEEAVIEFLTRSDMEFFKEYSPDWVGRRRYDFRLGYLLIEFDGAQHFDDRFNGSWGREFKKTIESDIFKTEKALENGYRLLRISYSELDNIEEHIERALASKDKLILTGKEYQKYEWWSEMG